MTRKLQWISFVVLYAAILAATVPSAHAQQGFFTPEDVIKYTRIGTGSVFRMAGPKYLTTFWIA